jgi:tellurite resistance-related uncharacterized protein
LRNPATAQVFASRNRPPNFTRENVPQALLVAHSVKAGVWLRVLRGRVRYCFDGEAPESEVIGPGRAAVIERQMPHHVELLDADSAFLVEFHRAGASP